MNDLNWTYQIQFCEFKDATSSPAAGIRRATMMDEERIGISSCAIVSLDATRRKEEEQLGRLLGGRDFWA